MSLQERQERLLALHEAVAHIADPHHTLGIAYRRRLRESHPLSAPNWETAINESLEHTTSRSGLLQLLKIAPPAPAAHVQLAGNVFLGAYRAIALALAQTSRVKVRASRRDGAMAELLFDATRGAFELVDELDAEPGDHVWAYGSDSTLEKLKGQLPAGCHLHPHGSGMGVAVLFEPQTKPEVDLDTAALGLALDTALFDQRGCLSPRMVIVEGSRQYAEDFADALYKALVQVEESIPRGKLTSSEQADIFRWETTVSYLGSSARAGAGMLFVDPEENRLVVPPIGRNLHLCVTSNALELLQPIGGQITSFGIYGTSSFPAQFEEKLKGQPLNSGLIDSGERRFSPFGKMQMPAFDGPVDKRVGFRSLII
ncbi:MAG: hypothetical protein MK135_06070 [Polyangiaceae bacterium]|nr:hypothetical protein [Polyangiaceae bacterium]